MKNAQAIHCTVFSRGYRQVRDARMISRWRRQHSNWLSGVSGGALWANYRCALAGGESCWIKWWRNYGIAGTGTCAELVLTCRIECHIGRTISHQYTTYSLDWYIQWILLGQMRIDLRSHMYTYCTQYSQPYGICTYICTLTIYYILLVSNYLLDYSSMPYAPLVTTE